MRIYNYYFSHTNWLQLTELVQREVLRESAVEDQTSVLSYFIQTAKVINYYCNHYIVNPYIHTEKINYSFEYLILRAAWT